MLLFLSTLALLGLTSQAFPSPPGTKPKTDYYVDSKGKGGDGKSRATAFKTIQACVNKLANAGDRCLILPGVYRESVEIKNKFGSEKDPLVIQGFGDWTVDKRPVLDGTRDISGNWRLWKAPENCEGYPIYYIPHNNKKVWQLFVDDEMMTNARWPNAKWSDKTIFDSALWGKTEDEKLSSEERLYDRNRKLSKSWVNAKDAVGVLNIGSWDTVVAKILDHKPGQDYFDVDNTWGKLVHFNPKEGQYFFEAKLDFLDSEEEWFIDDKFIYVWPKFGKDPKLSKVVGKEQEFAITISESANILFKDLDFFATAVTTKPFNDIDSHIGNLRFENLNFQYPSYSRRILREASKTNHMTIEAYARREKEWGNLDFFNCTWFGSDGIPLTFTGRKVSLVNNLFELNDWSGGNSDTQPSGGKATIMSGDSKEEIFVRNTLRNNGASAGYRPSKWSKIQLNDISGTCWGLAQNDGAAIQLMIGAQNAKPDIARNWLHDSPKLGLRFDCPNQGVGWPRLGRDATIEENVCWNARGLMIKGDNHHALHNLAFTKGSCSDLSDGKPHLIVPHWIGTNPVPFNNKTEIKFNIADIADGGVSRITRKRIPMSGDDILNNFPDPWDSCDEVDKDLVDVDNKDFRPIKNSKYDWKGAGPYKAGIPGEYWIPGRQNLAASYPIPAHEAQGIAINRDTLIFLQGYQATRHEVYFSSKKGLVDRRSPGTKLPVLQGGDNMADIRGKTLDEDTKYYWAVDAIDINNKVQQGETWEFRTIKNNLDVSDD